MSFGCSLSWKAMSKSFVVWGRINAEEADPEKNVWLFLVAWTRRINQANINTNSNLENVIAWIRRCKAGAIVDQLMTRIQKFNISSFYLWKFGSVWPEFLQWYYSWEIRCPSVIHFLVDLRNEHKKAKSIQSLLNRDFCYFTKSAVRLLLGTICTGRDRRVLDQNYRHTYLIK